MITDRIHIRPEQATDIEAIAEVHRLAFGEDEEATFVAAIRESDAFIPELALVAVDTERVVGHALFSKIGIETSNGTVDALALAPMAILPEYQRQGIGSLLISHGIEICKKHGHRIIIVVGHSEYYPKFGFKPATTYGLKAPFEVPSEAFLALELVYEALKGVEGIVKYSKAFDDVL